MQQSFEERNTANILLCLCLKDLPEPPQEDSGNFDGMKVEAGFDPTVKGNIIQQLRTKVRCEAAQKNQHAAQFLSKNNTAWASDPLSPALSFASYADVAADAAHLDTDCDSDNEDDDSFQPLPKSILNWKNGTVVSEEGAERKLSQEEMEHLRYLFRS